GGSGAFVRGSVGRMELLRVGGSGDSGGLSRYLLFLLRCYLTLIVPVPGNAIRSAEGTTMARSPPARRRLIPHRPASQGARRETRRRQHLRLYVVALGLGAVIATGADQQRQRHALPRRSGKMKHRDSCKPNETRIDMSGKAGPQGTPGPQGTWSRRRRTERQRA